MLSFIIIGKNEGWKLTNCITSIYKTIENNNLKNFEVIYVDSNSSDDSIARAAVFDNIRIFKITGKTNSAIARNIGARESKGDIYFFIDGDMEIVDSFLPLVYSEKNGLIYPFLTGKFVNFYFDNQWNYLSNDLHKIESLKEADKYFAAAGGLFLIEKEKWNGIRGMKSKLKVNEDIDIGIRLSSTGTRILKKSTLLAKHNTISYHDIRRIWDGIIKGNEWYRSVVLRDNLLNKYAWYIFIRENYSLFFLILVGFLSFTLKMPLILVIYPSLILIRVLLSTSKLDLWVIINRILYFFLRDIGSILAFFAFWPKPVQIIHYKYEKISYSHPQNVEI